MTFHYDSYPAGSTLQGRRLHDYYYYWNYLASHDKSEKGDDNGVVRLLRRLGEDDNNVAAEAEPEMEPESDKQEIVDDDYYAYIDDDLKQHPWYSRTMLIILALLLLFVIGYALHELYFRSADCKDCERASYDCEDPQNLDQMVADNDTQEYDTAKLDEQLNQDGHGGRYENPSVKVVTASKQTIRAARVANASTTSNEDGYVNMSNLPIHNGEGGVSA